MLLQAKTVGRLLEYLKTTPVQELDRMLTSSSLESYVFCPGLLHLDPDLAARAIDPKWW